MISFSRTLAAAALALGAAAQLLHAEAAPMTDTTAEGRSVAELIRSRDGAALERKFTPDMAAAVPIGPLQQLLDDTITKDSPLGDRVKESTDTANGFATYTAEHVWRRGQDLAIVIAFVKDGGKIAGLNLKVVPADALPPDPHAGYRLKAHLRLPFEPGNTWTVVWGGDTRALNYHVDYPDQRHAYDILIARNGVTHDGDGTQLDQYYAWGKRVTAPASGAVIEVVDDLPDNKPGIRDPLHAAGNHVELDLGNHEYAMLAHMQRGSIRVKPGDRVAPGQWLGLCGNSGNTSEPHVHFHVQDASPLFKPGVYGLPATFRDFVLNGKPVAEGAPIRGDKIAADPAAGVQVQP